MVNILLGILLVHYLIIIIKKPKVASLSCGLFGYLGSDVNYDKIKILGIANDKRGGDATGVYFADSNRMEKGLGLKSDFEDLTQTFDYEKSSIIIGHDRKASVGHKTMAETQPFNEDNIVLAHNGTLYDWEKLASKYNIDPKECVTDSHFLTKALSGGNFDVLADYKGAATLVWYYKDEPGVVYIFKGESPNVENGAYSSEERPLYGIFTKDGFYWSSLKPILNIIADSDVERKSIIDINTNKVFAVSKNDKNKIEFKLASNIDRSNAFQKKSYGYNYNNSYNKKVKKNKSNTNSSYKPVIIQSIERLKDFKLSTIFKDWRGIDDFEDERVNISKLEKDDFVFIQGRYFDSDLRPLHGLKYVNELDSKFSHIYQKDNDGKPYNFFRGIHVKSHASIAALGVNVKTAQYGSKEFAENLRQYADQPVFYKEVTYDNWTSIEYKQSYRYIPFTEYKTGDLAISYGVLDGFIPEWLYEGSEILWKDKKGSVSYINLNATSITAKNIMLKFDDSTYEYVRYDEISEYEEPEEEDDSTIAFFISEVLAEVEDAINDGLSNLETVNNTESELLISEFNKFKEKVLL